MRLFVRSLAVLLPALLLASCDGDWGFGEFDRYKEDFHYSFNVSPGGKLSLENFNGSVEITGTAGNTVEINGTKYANTEQALKDLKIDAQQSGDAVRIRTVPPYGTRNSMGARYTIRVPRKFELERIVSSNGAVRVEDVQGGAVLHTSNGSLRASRLQGNLDATTSNASIDLTDVTGNAILRTSNGSIRGEASKGTFEAHTSNASIDVRLTDPSEQPVRLESSNGHIDLTMNATREVRANTSNSGLTVRLPSSANARLRARTSNSSIFTEFEVKTSGTQSKNSLDGTLGSGGPLIDVSTSNGGIKILRL